MNRSTLARRYAPLAALAAVQLLIIATIPSVGANQQASQVAGGGYGTGGSTSSGVGAGSGSLGGSSSGGGSGGGASGVGGASGLAGASGESGLNGSGSLPSGGSLLPPGVATSGDTTHCVDGREWSTAIAYWAPPCVPGTPGAPDPDNGGATTMGVTSNEINVIDYESDDGAEDDAIEAAEGLYETFAQAEEVDGVYENFINKYYVLYGRKFNIIPYMGQCNTVPPDTNCLIPEMDKLAAQYHPLAVFWGSTVCSACFAELARDHVIAVGPAGFSDAFADANAPYFYSESESSTRMEEAFAEFYCKQLANSPVKFALNGNPAQNFNGHKRVLGLISANDPDNEDTVKDVLVPALKRECGVNVTHFYFYAQNINTAAQQTAAGIAAMDTPTNPATSVLCLCDTTAPVFFYEGEKADNYFPENLIAATEGMDVDEAAQAYDSGVACTGGKPCPFDSAFGLGPNGPEEPGANDEGARMYHDGGGGTPPGNALSNDITALTYTMFANLLENNGPDITAANIQARAPELPAVGGGASDQALLKFLPGDYSWEQDARVIYWDADRTSSFDGEQGTYVQIEGGRFNLGQYPTLYEPPIPNQPRPS
jgi:hypothetical protein